MATVSTKEDSRTANAEPTKRLLVNVLTKDIDLVAAILDLIDNSVDGARRLREDKSLKGLKVDVRVGEAGFSITDNCGGIPLSDAMERAFAFGPDPDDPPDPYSTGQFGIGMKRALFKMGRRFKVESVAKHDRFTLDVDVAEWLRQDGWTFALSKVREGLVTEEGERGTTIRVKPLAPGVREEMGRSTFANALAQQTASRHQLSLARGLQISIGDVKLKADRPKVVSDRKVRPWVVHESVNGAQPDVQVRIVCGVMKGKAADAGWSVFLNDRAVLLADRTEVTGWGEKGDVRLPKFHPQYNRFRGYTFLSCEDTTRLPWNTTKTGLDRDAPVYRAVRGMMLDVADPVVDFLDAIKDEGGDQYGLLRTAVDEGKTVSVTSLMRGQAMKWSAPEAEPPPPQDETTRIYTDQPLDLVEEVKAKLEVSSNREVGDELFEYFLEREM